ncbi:MAG: transcriptional repressor LexA [Verrucomicrobiales bacterium]
MLTVRQQQLLDFLRDHQRLNGLMPSTREIQRHFGFASQTAAVSHLRALERKGMIKKLAGKARALIFPGELGRGETVNVPVYGSIPAGMPWTGDNSADGSICVDMTALGLSRRAKTFALGVRGDSMIDAHILPGDHAIFEAREARHGDIVAALIDGETTLKRLVMKDGRPFLKAENPAYPDLTPVTELMVQGVMVGLVRRQN